MENNEWDDLFRELLGDCKSPDPVSPLGTNPDALNSVTEDPISPDPDQIQAWKRIEASLNAADYAFDETLRQKVHHFHPKYDPHSWPVFLKRFTDRKFLRTKLIVLKSVEVAVFLLLVWTAVNMGRMGKFPFDSTRFESKTNIHAQDINAEKIKPEPQPATPILQKLRQDRILILPKPIQIQTRQLNRIRMYLLQKKIRRREVTRKSELLQYPQRTAIHNHQSSTLNPIDNISGVIVFSDARGVPSSITEIPAIATSAIIYNSTPAAIPEIAPASPAYITDPLADVDFAFEHHALNVIPEPNYIKPLNHTYTEFGVMTQGDYNALRMPEDRLYTSGRQIIFPSKGIMSAGYGAGFTIAIGHPVWALETGVVYSAKDFEPGRQLIIGGAFDNGVVEFEAMKLQLVSVPVQYRYRFDHKGRVKSYAMAGGGFHVIAQSDIDVQIKYHFASLSFGQNPNTDPDLAQTILETRRIREHIRDGAPFSTKSFVSVNAGLGLEYMLSEHKAFFIQSVIQYQIPNIQFSNNNGKHLRSISLQAGVRGPLGK